MKLAIRTLAALLALSSTAVAEDWIGVSVDGGWYGYLANGNPPTGTSAALHGNESIMMTCSSASGGLIMSGESQFANCPTGQDTGLFFVPVSQFARSDRLDSVSGRVTALEASASTFATTANLNGVASRVTAIEGSLGSFASAGSLNGVAARVAAIEASVGSMATTANLNALATRVADAESQLAAIQNSVSDLAAFVPEALGDIRRHADEGSAMAAAMTIVAPADGKANRVGFNTATYNGTTALALSYSRAAGDVDFNVGVAMAGDNAMVKAGAGFSW